MRISIVALTLMLAAALLAGCASAGKNWVRADGSSFSEEELETDKVDCFPTTPDMGPASMGLNEAKDCMRRKGWRKEASS